MKASRLSKLMKAELASAETYSEWSEIAKRRDKLDSRDNWKIKESSNLYDYKAIRTRLDNYRELRAQNNDHGLLFALNEGIHGNMGGMGNSDLYKQSHFGTKQLIVDYVDEVTAALQHLANPSVTSIPLEEKLEFFHRARHCYGRSALMLSGSGSLFYFHFGVVKALWEEDILPSVMTGASGGAIVSAIVGSRSREDLTEIFDPSVLKMEVERDLNRNRRTPFSDLAQISPKEIQAYFERIIPDMTFQEAAALTGIHINVSVAAAEKHQTSRLLNDIASPNVMLREAVMASSALPGFFPAVTLAAKDENGQRKPYLPSRKWIDGSVSDDLPTKRVMRLYGVNHTIVSQTNPIALPFVEEYKATDSWGMIKRTLKSTVKDWVLTGAKLIDKPAKNRPTISRLLAMTHSVLSQTYTGDINILPPKRIHNPVYLLLQRSTDDILELIKHGERATWPQIEKIRIQTKISHTLDHIIDDLELSMAQQATALAKQAGEPS